MAEIAISIASIVTFRVLYRNNWYDVWSLERGRSSYFYSQEDIINRYSNYDLIATGETAFDRRQVPCAENYCNNISGWEIINAFPKTNLFAENLISLEFDDKGSKPPPESCYVCQEVLVSDGVSLESLEGEANCVILNQNSTVELITTDHKECGVTESWGYARKLDGTVANLSSAERRIVSWGDPSPVIFQMRQKNDISVQLSARMELLLCLLSRRRQMQWSIHLNCENAYKINKYTLVCLSVLFIV